MRKLLLIFISFITCSLQAQLYVSDNSYILNRNSYVYVTGNIELNGANSNFYLRGEGQLLQGGTTPDGSNKGIGKLSVFQEGTANNYGYNYWCSPVGVGSPTAPNGVFSLNPVINRPTGVTTSATPTFTGSYNGTATNGSLAISPAWIYKFVASDNYSQWVFMGETGTAAAGLGFTMKGVSGSDDTNISETLFNNIGSRQRYDFRGKPNDGTISIRVLPPAGLAPNNTLTGNPYPSAINLNYFLLENSGYTIDSGGVPTYVGSPVINGTAYFWEHEKPATSHVLVQYIGGYGYYVPNGATANNPGTYTRATWRTYNIDGSLNGTAGMGLADYKRMFLPIGQGFMVEGVADGYAVMKNVYRVYRQEGNDPTVSNSQFEKTNNQTQTNDNQNWDEIPNVAGVDYTQFSRAEVPQIKIHTVINNLFTREVTLAFNPNALDGYELAYDAKSNEGDFTNDAYLSVTDNSNPIIISTLPFGIDKRIPFTLKAGEQCSFKVDVANIINFNGSENIYLYDGETGLYHDIKNNSYVVTLSPGIYANRFEITFRNSSLNTNDDIKSSLIITQNNTSQTVTIHNPNSLELKSVKLYDLTGKQVFDKQRLGSQNSYQFSTNGLAESVYLVEVFTTDNRKMVQKIIVSSN